MDLIPVVTLSKNMKKIKWKLMGFIGKWVKLQFNYDLSCGEKSHITHTIK